MRLFAVCVFWHSEGWTARNKALMWAVVKQARSTKHPWLFACDANMDPEMFKKSTWHKDKYMFIEVPGEENLHLSTPRAQNGELIERTFDYTIAI